MTVDDLAELRERAKAHQAELDRSTEFYKPSDLITRWGISATTLRGIPYDLLPYMEYGQGLKLKRRRYKPEAVAAYESREPGRVRQGHASGHASGHAA